MALAEGTALSSYGHGEVFDKCIKISDWESATLSSDIELSDRDSNGCCPAGSVPGQKHTTSYTGAQVTCGFKADGTIQMSTSTSNGVSTCTYNNCFVQKWDFTCEDGSKMLLNGCCAAPDACSGNACGFQADCKNYASSMSNVHSESTEYCTTYHKNYGTIGMHGTAVASDDVTDADPPALNMDNLYMYALCEEGGGSSGGSNTASMARAQQALSAAVAVLAVVSGWTLMAN